VARGGESHWGFALGQKGGKNGPKSVKGCGEGLESKRGILLHRGGGAGGLLNQVRLLGGGGGWGLGVDSEIIELNLGTWYGVKGGAHRAGV